MNNGTQFLNALERKAKLFSSGVSQLQSAHPELCGWLLDPLADWAEKAYGDTIFEVAARGYVEYCMNVAKEQRRYEKTGEFTNQQLSEVKEHIYEDEGYMDPYMWAAILIYGFWPSMIDHLRMYRDDFINKLPENPRILELASGHGVMGLLAAHHRSDLRVDGYDISPPAVRIAEKLTAASGLGERANFEVKDALSFEDAGAPNTYNGVIAAMLAEHLADPVPLFKTIKYHLAPDGIAFFSTAIESAQPDHIYEFNFESEPVKMAEDAGLRLSRLVSDASDAKPGTKYQPRAVAMILTHR